jgi:small subunit ribosomal protein S20
MAHSKQALKRNRQNQKARLANKTVRSGIKSAAKKAVSTGAAGDQAAAMKRLDKAAGKGVIHKNTAARRKSRLARALNKKAAAAKK